MIQMEFEDYGQGNSPQVSREAIWGIRNGREERIEPFNEARNYQMVADGGNGIAVDLGRQADPSAI